jgi:hypothetical protein
MQRILHFLDSRLTDDGGVDSFTRRPLSSPQKHFIFTSGTHFCQRLSKPQSTVRLEGLGKLNKTVTPSGIEPAIFRLIAYGLSQLYTALLIFLFHLIQCAPKYYGNTLRTIYLIANILHLLFICYHSYIDFCFWRIVTAYVWIPCCFCHISIQNSLYSHAYIFSILAILNSQIVAIFFVCLHIGSRIFPAA